MCHFLRQVIAFPVLSATSHGMNTPARIQKILDSHKSWAYCTACQVMFSSDKGATRHPRKGVCLHPTEIGLVFKDKGAWGFPPPTSFKFRKQLP